MENRSSSRLAEWLDKLARESWQLELIISGFAIFLLAGIYEPLQGMGDSIERLNLSFRMQVALGLPFGILKASWYILLINLCVHVLFRGLWISTVGLRSVSDDIDFEALKLQPRFDRFLQRRIGSFDRYIERLEKICSVLFAFTFLILFMLLALVGVIVLLSMVNLLLRDWLGLGNHWIAETINIFLFFCGFLYFIDFVTLARLKRVRWLAPVYYPAYRFFSLVTLAVLYRPLYYNLIDNRFGRGVGLLLVPYVLFLMVASSLSYGTDAYFPNTSGQVILKTSYYDDLRPEDEFSQLASIPSRYVDNGFLELFLPYDPGDDDESIQAICPDLQAARITGLKLSGVINLTTTIQGVNTDSLLLCMGGIHRILVDDSLHADPPWHFYTHPKREDNGLLTILDVQYLPRGEHLLRLETRRVGEEALEWKESARIPFWKE
jgi:hypothetical protein